MTSGMKQGWARFYLGIDLLLLLSMLGKLLEKTQ